MKEKRVEVKEMGVKGGRDKGARNTRGLGVLRNR